MMMISPHCLANPKPHRISNSRPHQKYCQCYDRTFTFNVEANQISQFLVMSQSFGDGSRYAKHWFSLRNVWRHIYSACWYVTCLSKNQKRHDHLVYEHAHNTHCIESPDRGVYSTQSGSYRAKEFNSRGWVPVANSIVQGAGWGIGYATPVPAERSSEPLLVAMRRRNSRILHHPELA